MTETQPVAASAIGLGESTRAVHAGLPAPEPGQPFLPPTSSRRWPAP